MKTEVSIRISLRGVIISFCFMGAGFLCPTTNAQCIAPPEGMIGWWPGDGNTDDLIGGNNGTLVGNVTFTSGLVGQAFSFDGSSYVEVPDAPNLNFNSTSPITIDMWVFRTSNATRMHVIGKRSGCGSMNYQMGLNTDSGEGLFFGNGSGDEVATGQDLPLNVWTHIAGTFDGTTYQFFINGALVASAAGTLGDPVPDPLRIGTSGDCEKFGGLIDEVEIFDRALSQQEIQDIFNAGPDGKCKQAPVITSPLSADGQVGTSFAYQITADNGPSTFGANPLPPGLSIDIETGLISGTPTMQGSFLVTLTASNVLGSGTALLTITISPILPPAPVITSGPFPSGSVGQPFSYQITATNNPTSFDATGLPLGLTRNTSTGLISGTPSEEGTFAVTLSATNAGGTGSKALTLTVTPAEILPVPIITSPLSATATVGQFYVYQILATDSPTSYDAINLPPGLSPDPVLGFLSGIPTEAGTSQVTLSAANGNGSGTAILALTVQDPPVSGPTVVSGTSVTGRTGSPFKFQVLSSGGSAAARLTASALPDDLEVNPITGEISGVPAADGSSSVTLTVTEAGMSTTSTLQLTFTFDLAIPVITSPSSATLIPGQFFSYQIVAPSSSAEPTMFYQIGPLPPGLELDSVTGLISGIPRVSFGLLPTPSLSSGVITNTEIVACNSSGCAGFDLFFPAPEGAENISTRLSVGTEGNVLIGGFITEGNAALKLVVRGIGPSLAQSKLTGVLANPYLKLFDGTGAMIGENDNWKDDLGGGSQEIEIKNTGFAPTYDLESAIQGVLDPGGYTTIVSGTNNGTGVGLVEVYSLNVVSLDVSNEAHLANISTRGNVQTGDNVMIGGFVNAKEIPIKVLLRGIGPSLAEVGLSGVLANPMLELHDSNGATIATNDDWMSDPSQKADIMATGLAPKNDLESAILITIPAGQNTYTAIVSGASDTTGIGLVEAYFGDPCVGTSCP